jgi:hypothetical protein
MRVRKRRAQNPGIEFASARPTMLRTYPICTATPKSHDTFRSILRRFETELEREPRPLPRRPPAGVVERLATTR